ncbi:large ribosomal subunit protein mL42 [Eurosta solidaginis]|uniref:large ribosomal subunit protein mL42 n=1 Tax=Eurosta solidaginis TaxID=178769 RepID=UPI003531796B
MNTRFLRLFSNSAWRQQAPKNAIGGKNLVEKIAVTNDGDLIVAWHPNTPFPYECSKPIPKAVDTQTGMLIKEAALRNAMSAFKDKKPEIARQELMKLTHTTKHRWFPRARDKRAKKTPMDRPYL